MDEAVSDEATRRKLLSEMSRSTTGLKGSSANSTCADDDPVPLLLLVPIESPVEVCWDDAETAAIVSRRWGIFGEFGAASCANQ